MTNNQPEYNVDTTKATTHIGLCAGYGGIELGLKRVIPDLRTVALCEIEAFACANLVAKMEAGLMDPAPIWSDLKTFPWAEFSGRVDILTGGYPCQPFSAAGKRAGKDDPRHLWPWIADGIRLLQPRCCFFENVEGHITLGLSTVISDLEEMGYRTTWGIFSASEVGAPHQRKRVFILAHNQREQIKKLSRWIADESQQHPAWNDGGDVWPSRPGEPQHGWEPPRVVSGLANSTSTGSGSEGGDAVHQGWSSSDAWATSVSQNAERQTGAAITDDQSASGDGATMGNATQLFSNGGNHYDGISERFEKVSKPRDPSGEGLGNAASRQDDGRGYRDVEGQTGSGKCGHDAADGAGEGMGNAKLQGLEGRTIGGDDHTEEFAKGCAGETESSLGRGADGPADRMDDAGLYVTYDNRTDELRLLGNGVVPATAERAFRVLMGQAIV